jgi:hypothetical protein
MGSHNLSAIPRVQAPLQCVAECECLHYLVYLDVFGAWRWEFRGADGHFADCPTSYDSRAECSAAGRAAALVFNSIQSD